MGYGIPPCHHRTRHPPGATTLVLPGPQSPWPRTTPPQSSNKSQVPLDWQYCTKNTNLPPHHHHTQHSLRTLLKKKTSSTFLHAPRCWFTDLAPRDSLLAPTAPPWLASAVQGPQRGGAPLPRPQPQEGNCAPSRQPALRPKEGLPWPNLWPHA
jgi:hypothetical protein